ncbi:MAG: long-chain fatty acid--CoA ligase [Halobacteriales archaeon]|nr:long-chain fatty acid--CoA ligase [Halobacteriales archaeon]
MDWRTAEAEFEDHVMGKVTLSRMFADAASRNGREVAQQYKGGIYDRTLTPDVLPEVPAGEWGQVSYEAMHDVVKRLATGFRALGVEAGDRVGIFAQTRMEWAHADLGLLAAGGVVSTVYTSSSPRQVEYLLGDAGATGVVVENDELFGRVLEVEDELDLEFVVLMDESNREAAARDDVYTLADVHAIGDEAFDEADYQGWLDERDPDDLASLIYTSGTTGQPKGVELTHWNFKANVDQIRKRYGPRPDKGDLPTIGPDSLTIAFLPLAHVFERLVGHFHAYSAGATVSYAENADTLGDDIEAIRPNTVPASVPRVYEKIFAAIREQASQSPVKERIFNWAIEVGREYATTDEPGALLSVKQSVADRLVFSTVREALGGEIDLLFSGGGSLSKDLIELYHGMGLPVLEGYGLTETAPVVTINPFEAPKIGTIGTPVFDMETALDPAAVEDDEFDDAPGEVGELLVRGPNVARGYWNKPDQTADAFVDELPEGAVQVVDWETAGGDRGQWFHTGDIVAQDDEGYITFLERAKEIIVLSTGKNLAPTPIEDAFSEVEIVEQAMVIGDERKFVGALIVPNFEAVRKWAEKTGIDLPEDPAAVCEHDRVHGRIEDEVEAINEGFESHETIKRFRLVPEEFTEDNDLLTPSLKKKRRNILERFAEEVEEIYADA